MSKISLVVEAELHEDDTLREYLDGPKWKLVIIDVDSKLRSMVKYEDKMTVDIDSVRTMIRNAISHYDLILG